MRYIIQQPIYGGIVPAFLKKFDSFEEAKAFKDKFISRMHFYIDRKRAGLAVGKKTIEELEQDLKEVLALEILQV